MRLLCLYYALCVCQLGMCYPLNNFRVRDSDLLEAFQAVRLLTLEVIACLADVTEWISQRLARDARSAPTLAWCNSRSTAVRSELIQIGKLYCELYLKRGLARVFSKPAPRSPPVLDGLFTVPGKAGATAVAGAAAAVLFDSDLPEGSVLSPIHAQFQALKESQHYFTRTPGPRSTFGASQLQSSRREMSEDVEKKMSVVCRKVVDRYLLHLYLCLETVTEQQLPLLHQKVSGCARIVPSLSHPTSHSC